MNVQGFIGSLAIAGSLAVASVSAALAADLNGDPKYGSIKDAPYVAPLRTWTGFYIGAHLGGNWSNYTVDGFDGAFNNTGTTSYKLKPSQFIGGGQMGYNWQTNGFVFGLEGQYSFGNSSKTITPSGDFVRIKTRDTATLAARFGFASGAWMPYLKVGAAWAKVNGTAGDNPGGVLVPTDVTSFSSSRTGWLVGGGMEYMLDRNWSLKAEYQYMDYGSFNTGNIDGDRYRHKLRNNNFTVGVNYRF